MRVKRNLFVWIMLLIYGMSSLAAMGKYAPMEDTGSGTRIITDMAGRTLEIPKEVNTVLARCMIGTTLVYTLDPGCVAGLNWYPTEAELEFLDQDYLELPMLAGWHAGDEGNVEEIIAMGPSVLISASFNPEKDQAGQELADLIEEQTGIPVVIFDFRLQSLPATYHFLGELLGMEDRAEELANYAQTFLTDLAGKTESIAEEDRVTLYYAEGVQGLQTDPAGSFHTQVIDLAAAVNVAQVEMKSGMGRSQVSPEQLLKWDPEVVICCHDQGFSNIDSTYQDFITDPRFTTLRAIQDGRVYEVPYKPFNFMDRPPSVNRLLGLKWLVNLIYPEIFSYDIRTEIREFYSLFYRIELSDRQIDEILISSRGE